MTTETRRTVPWQHHDATRIFVLNLVGLAFLILGYVEVSGTARLSHQYGWASFAVIGALIAGVGNGLWVLAGRRAVGARTRRLLAMRAEIPRPVEWFSSPEAVDDAPRDGIVASPAMSRYHRATCVLAHGKPVSAKSRAQHERDGRSACEVCRP